MKYDKDAAGIIRGVGGEDNIASVFHCVTRLRFTLRDDSLADPAALAAVPTVMGTNRQSGQYQVIIGDKVPDVFRAVVGAAPRLAGDGASTAEKPRSRNPFAGFFDFIGGVFAPILPAIAGAGLLKGLLALLSFVGWIDLGSPTAMVLSAIGDAAFYFLPVLVAMTAARKLDTNPYVAVAFAGVLVYPQLVEVLGSGEAIDFLGVPVTATTYSYAVIPVLLGVYLMSWVERGLNRIIPRPIRLMVVPLITLIVVAPITLVALGPLGTFVGNGVSGGITWALANGGPIAGAVIGALLPLIIMTGVHYALVPFILTNLAQTGVDKFLPLTYVQGLATAGAAFGVALRAKSKQLRSLAFSTAFTGVMGVTEPALYGLVVPLKRPLVATMIGGAAGGAISLGFGVDAYVLAGNSGVPGLPGLIGDTFAWAIVAIVVAFIVSAVATALLGFDESAYADRAPAASDEHAERGSVVVASPATGEAVALDTVPDQVFASGVMGDGCAVRPSNGEVVAPLTGTVEALFPTHHAFGIRTDDGLEVLVHVGVDTVALNGEGFAAHVAQGDRVAAGDRILTVDVERVAETHDTSVIVVVTENTGGEMSPARSGAVTAGSPLFALAPEKETV